MKKSAFSLGKIFGIEVKIHYTFFLIILIVALNTDKGFNFKDFFYELGLMLTIFLCVVLHEFGHAFAARFYGIGTKQIILLPIGGVAQLEDLPKKPGQELFVAIAGPLVNLVIAAIILTGFYFYQPVDTLNYLFTNLDSNFMIQIAAANLGLLIFNLVPAFPMDGGRILRALLSFKLDKYTATLIAARTGQVIAVVGSVAGYIYLKNPILFITALFIISGAEQELRYYKHKKLSGEILALQVCTKQFKSFSIESSAISVAEFSDTKEFPGALVFDNFTCVGLLNEEELALSKTLLPETKVKDFMRKNFPFLNGTESIEKVFQMMDENRLNLIPVLPSSFIEGVIYK